MLGYHKGKRFPWGRCPFGRHHLQAEARGGHASAQAADTVDPEQSERVMSQEAGARCHAKLSAERSRGVRLSLVGKGKHQQGREEPSLMTISFSCWLFLFYFCLQQAPPQPPAKLSLHCFSLNIFFFFCVWGRVAPRGDADKADAFPRFPGWTSLLTL